MLPNDKIIAIDIDGTICSVEEDYSKCILMPGCLEALTHIRNQGYLIFLHTGRHINNFEITVSWLKENNVIYDNIVFGKPPAKYYIDDRAIFFTNWDNIIKNIQL